MSSGLRQLKKTIRTGSGESPSLLQRSILNVKFETIRNPVYSRTVELKDPVPDHLSVIIECADADEVYGKGVGQSAPIGPLLWALYTEHPQASDLVMAVGLAQTGQVPNAHRILLVEQRYTQGIREFAELLNTIPATDAFSLIGYRTNVSTGLNILANLPCDFLQITDMERLNPDLELLFQLSGYLNVPLFRPHDNEHAAARDGLMWAQLGRHSESKFWSLSSATDFTFELGKNRCDWVTDPLLAYYHDYEWGIRPTHESRWFEFVVLETFQAGLSWKTILNKRLGFRKAFRDFDIDQVAQFDDGDVERLMSDTGIVRNRKKILAAIENAKIIIQLREQFGSLNDYFMHLGTLSDPLSDLTRTFRFVGKTTAESIAFATGLLVPPHDSHCHRHSENELILD